MAIMDFLDPGRGYKSAMKEYTKGYEEGKGYLDPYAGAGTDQLDQLLGAQGALMDPAALQNQWAQGYEMSPYAQQMQGAAQEAGLSSMGSMGLGGSSAALQNLQQTSSNIMQADRQNYMDDLMKKYTEGVGIGQDIYGKGAGAAGQLGQMGMQYGQGMGELKAMKSQSRNQMLMDLLGLGGQAYGASQFGGGNSGGSGGGNAGTALAQYGPELMALLV
jgi:hypothetical protein